MAFRMINLATLNPPCAADRDHINAAAYLLKLDIAFVEAGGGFINVTGPTDAISEFVRAIQFPALDYERSQKGDVDEDV